MSNLHVFQATTIYLLLTQDEGNPDPSQMAVMSINVPATGTQGETLQNYIGGINNTVSQALQGTNITMQFSVSSGTQGVQIVSFQASATTDTFTYQNVDYHYLSIPTSSNIQGVGAGPLDAFVALGWSPNQFNSGLVGQEMFIVLGDATLSRSSTANGPPNVATVSEPPGRITGTQADAPDDTKNTTTSQVIFIIGIIVLGIGFIIATIAAFYFAHKYKLLESNYNSTTTSYDLMSGHRHEHRKSGKNVSDFDF